MKKYFNAVWMGIMTIGVIFSIVISTVMMTRIGTLQKHHNTPNRADYEVVKKAMFEAEKNYKIAHYNLIDEVDKYIKTIAPKSNLDGFRIVEMCEKYNLDVIFVLAQGEIESHYATRGCGMKLNNVFNVGVFDNVSVDDINDKYCFRHPNKSVEPYMVLLTTRYAVDGKTEFSLLENYVDINGNRYASNENYENMLKTKYQDICDNTNIDELEADVRHWRVQCEWF